MNPGNELHETSQDVHPVKACRSPVNFRHVPDHERISKWTISPGNVFATLQDTVAAEQVLYMKL